MCRGENQGRNGLESDIGQIILLDHEQEYENDKKQRTDREPRIGLVVVHDVIGQCNPGHSRNKQPIDDCWVKAWRIGCHGQVDQAREDKKERQGGDDEWQQQNLIHQFHDDNNAQDAINHKRHNAIQQELRRGGKEKYIGQQRK